MDIQKDKQILLIDDQLDFCTLVQDILKDSICALSYNTDSREGLRQALTRRDLDLILLDIDMPDPDGIEILHQLKKSHARNIPVMMFTARAEMDVVHKVLEMGASSYILKPFRVHDFIAHINQALHINIFYHRIQDVTGQNIDNNSVPGADLLPHVVTRRLLMVDDEARELELIQDVLEGSSCAVIGTQDPHEGLRIAEQQAPDLILLDIHMPEMSGVDFLRTLRGKGLKTPVMILTSDGSIDTVSAVKAYDVYGFVLKPFKFHFFIHQLEQALGTKLFAGKL